jgi:hypothetical protein
VGFRRGDSAEVAQVELVGSEFDPKAKADTPAGEEPKPKAKGVGGRLRAAAERPARQEGRQRAGWRRKESDQAREGHRQARDHSAEGGRQLS